MKKQVLIVGASGSGTTTIARKACRKLGYAHFDSDNHWDHHFKWWYENQPL